MAESAPADPVREFVIASHGNLPKVKEMLAADPRLLDAGYSWQENDVERPIQAASHVGNVVIAKYLLGKGAPLAIYTAAMLGRWSDVESMLAADSSSIQAKGAHGIPLLAHAAFSGDVSLIADLFQRGAAEGVSFALGNAVTAGKVRVVEWLLENAQPDLSWQNFQGHTPLQIAADSGFAEIVELLKAHS